jgi:hypothetical protein
MMKMRRLLLTPLVVAVTLAVAPTAHADPAFQTECTRFPGAFPGATGGQIIINSGGIFANCRYPGPAEGGGAEMLPGTDCVIAPAGNFQCHR